MHRRCLAALLTALALTAATVAPAQSGDGRDVLVVRRDAPPNLRYGARLALVVGIDRYEHLAELGYAEKDAKDLEAALRAIGFVVKPMRRDTRDSPARAESILAAVSDLCKGADPQDTILIFLSGHGFSERTGAPFFCAEFTDPQNLAVTGLSLEEVRRRLVASKAKQKMLVVDACRNVPERSAGDRPLDLDAFMAEGLGILFSTAPGYKSWEPRARELDKKERTIQNGIFTHFLLRGLDGEADGNGDGWVTFRELAYYVGTEVKAQTTLKQKPFLLWDGDAGGDIPLRAVAPGAAASPAPVPAPTPASARGGAATTAVAPKGCRAARGAKVVDGVWDRIEEEKIGLVLVYVPPGEFLMGSPDSEGGRDKSAERQHRRVIRRGFYLGETEVTVAMWQAYSSATGYKTDAERGVEWAGNKEGGLSTSADGKVEWSAKANWKNPFPSLNDYRLDKNHPVVMVSWNDAKAFCDHYGMMLPSEAQFEYANRAGSQARYPWGETEAGGFKLANVPDQSAKRRWQWKLFPFDDGNTLLARVGSYEANRFGLKDMTGNCWEWCADVYDASYPGDGADESPVMGGALRVLRGGSWNSNPVHCRAAYRDKSEPTNRSSNAGFRVARTL